MIVAVIGAGTMGRGIAQVLTASGCDVLVHDRNGAAAYEAVRFVGDMLDRAAAKGRMEVAETETAKRRLRVAETLEELAPAEMAIEAIAEDLDAKRALVCELEDVLAEDAVLATNTSSLSVSAIAGGARRPERVVGLHFFNPVPLMKVVEVIPGLRTGAAAREAASALVERIGYRAIACRDAPGFVINHAGRGLLTEGIRIVQDGLAAEADVDRVMREAAGFRMGPFELLDLTGLDVSNGVLSLIYAQFHHDPRYRPGAFLAARVVAGLHGRKTGEGFYTYADRARVDPPEAVPEAASLPPVYVPPEMRGDLTPALDALRVAGVETTEKADGALCILAPWGWDATETAIRCGFDPAYCVALDPLTAAAPRLTIMPTPATDPALTRALHGALFAAGRQVTAMQDSPGFIAQRVLAMIVNIGCEIAQMRIASPEDIDEGVRIGLGYPRGPLAMGDDLGPARVLAVLDALQKQTGDPRYRPSQFLRQRARLGMRLAA